MDKMTNTANLVVLPFSEALPEQLAIVEPDAKAVMRQFFGAEVENPRTRRAYLFAAADFFHFVAPVIGAGSIASINALHMAAWIESMKARGLSSPTIKQRLAGVRMLFQSLTREQIIKSNPASVVKGPKHSVTRGKTPVLDGAETNRLLDSIDTSTLLGLRDRAMIGTMAYSFARISAVTALKVGDIFRQKQRLWLRLAEKGGKSKDVPCHHHLEAYIAEWLDAAKLVGTPSAPLFQTFTWPATPGSDSEDQVTGPDPCNPRRRILSGEGMTQAMTWEMLQRRKKAAGIDTAVCNHTFRATGITAYLSNGGTIERAANIAGHASTRTTQLYDRRPDDVTLDEIEKIHFG